MGIKLLGRWFEVEGLLFDVVSLLVRVGIAGVHGRRINVDLYYCIGGKLFVYFGCAEVNVTYRIIFLSIFFELLVGVILK